jgi:replicative DNA helicase
VRLAPIEAERSVLGAILRAACLDVDAGHRVVRRVRAAGLDPEHFALASHGALFEVFIVLTDAGEPLDPVSVAAEIDARHEDPHLMARLQVLAHETPVVSAAERYARIVIEAALRREVEARSVGT